MLQVVFGRALSGAASG